MMDDFASKFITDDPQFGVISKMTMPLRQYQPEIARKIIESFKKPKMPNLTDREHEIVQGILDGFTYLQIAEKYFITIDTVRSHIKNIYKKLSINSKAQLFKLFRN